MEAFRRALETDTGKPVFYLDRPDRRARGQPGCDAILEKESKPIAIEIKIVETFPGQYADDAVFRGHIVPLEAAIAAASSQSAITVAIPIGALPKGQKWSQIATDLQKGVIAELTRMKSDDVSRPTIAGVPFQPTIWKHSRGTPGCYFARIAPGAQLTIAKALQHADGQLAPYKNQGNHTVALLDSNDTALVGPIEIVETVAKEPLPGGGIDDIYVARTMPGEVFVYPARIGTRVLPNLPELVRFMEQRT